MKHTIKILVSLCFLTSLHWAATPALADTTIKFKSGPEPAQLLELYTSQGCSSCPPADKWLSQWKQDKRLWKQIIPVAFHVDYWDWIGWQDPFAQPEFGNRQRYYKQVDATKSVYTPGFIVDGKEWRGWFNQQALPQPIIKKGELEATLSNTQLMVTYRNPQAKTGLTVHAAILGFDLQTPVKRGENTNKVLIEDFVALWYEQQSQTHKKWEFILPPKQQFPTQRLAIALWITPSNKPTPLQITGGWLP